MVIDGKLRRAHRLVVRDRPRGARSRGFRSQSDRRAARQGSCGPSSSGRFQPAILPCPAGSELGAGLALLLCRRIGGRIEGIAHGDVRQPEFLNTTLNLRHLEVHHVGDSGTDVDRVVILAAEFAARLERWHCPRPARGRWTHACLLLPRPRGQEPDGLRVERWAVLHTQDRMLRPAHDAGGCRCLGRRVQGPAGRTAVPSAMAAHPLPDHAPAQKAPAACRCQLLQDRA